MSHTTHNSLNRVDTLLIIMVTFSWGLNYPVMKFVVNQYPPASYRAFSFLLGLIALGIYALLSKQSLAVQKNQIPEVIKLSLPNMVFWHVGLIYGITLLQSGRAAIVGYTMPAWALLVSVLFFKTPLNHKSLYGVLCSLCATGLLAYQEFFQFMGHPLGLLFTLFAAFSWGCGTAMTKHSPLRLSTLALTFWMLMSAFLAFTVIAMNFERDGWRWPNGIEWLCIAYSGVMTFAISYVAWFKVVRKLSPVKSGLSIMLVPIIGLMGGWMVLGEHIALTDMAALGLILCAMALVLPKEQTNVNTEQPKTPP